MVNADDDFEIVATRDGRKVKIIRDGGRVRVPLTMMDSMSPLQKAVAAGSFAHARSDILRAIDDRPAVVDAFGRSGELALSRPGLRYAYQSAGTTDPAVQVTLRTICDEAYRLHDLEESRRWQGDDREIPVKPITGDARADARLAREQHDTNAWREATR
jgi:hypothetical protein